MRVNIIGNLKKNTGVSQDVHILHGMIAHAFGKDVLIRHIPHYYPQCPQAEVNFFIEVVNPALFMFAKKNIWIPNPEWTYKTWEPYARMVDEIWVKTREAETLFSEWSSKVVYVGWTSIDKVMPDRKNYAKAIVPVGKNMWRNPRPLIQTYMWIRKNDPALYTTLPELHIVHSPEHVAVAMIPPEIASKVILHSEVMKEADYDELLHECGLCICLSAAEGFGHAVNEAMSAGCILLLSPVAPFMELTQGKNVLWVSELKRTAHPQCLGDLYDVDQRSVCEALGLYSANHFHWKRGQSDASREMYEANHQAFIQRITERLQATCEGIQEYVLEEQFPKEDDMPKVSVITVTRDRRAFIPLAKYCFLAQSYPEDKLEWVIVDDGNDQIKDLVSDLPNVKYILCDGTLTIGAKRNLAVQSASHDVLCMMDDDDVYPNNSVLTRVAYLMAEPKQKAVFCTTIPCFDIHDKKSFMNVPPNVLRMSERVSEATLCFTREFWNARQFPDEQIAEGNAFIRGREEMCRDVSPQDVIVSLIHKKNTSSRKTPEGPANGCHYGFSDDLYTLVSEIAESVEGLIQIQSNMD